MIKKILGGGGGGDCICRNTGMCHCSGYLFCLLSDFWVSLWIVFGFFGIIFFGEIICLGSRSTQIFGY